MNLLLVADGHYYLTPDGAVYSDSVYDYSFYKRYLRVFDQVYAVIRAQSVQEVPKGKRMASGSGVVFILMPNYHGPYQYLKKFFEIKHIVRRICKDEKYQCAIFRIPAATSNDIARRFSKTRKPFAVEVVVDPWENFGPRSRGNRLMLWYVRRDWTNAVRTLCEKADGSSYVTERYLQKLYPPKVILTGEGFTASYSSVELAKKSFGSPRVWPSSQKKFRVSHVANFFSSYGKGHLTVMDAIKRVRIAGYDVSVIFVGDGPKRAEFEAYAKQLGIADSVHFTGRLANGDEVRKVIANSDIFILPTYAEGLPRVLLEAMSVGLPCLSSPVCGIPEILKNEYLYDFSDSCGFSEGIIKFISSPEELARASRDNINTAERFTSEILTEKRDDFYKRLRELAEKQIK